jgi:hypothetical protein
MGKKMAAKKQPAVENTATSTETQRASTVAQNDVVPAAPTTNQQDEQMAKQIVELKDLVASLAVAVQETQARSAQNTEFQNTISEIKRVATTIPTAAGYSAMPRPASVKDDCDDCGCGCIDSSCCCFEIVLDKVRAIQPQGILEIADSGDTTLPVPLINELEVRLFAAIDNVGILIPSLSTTMGLRVPSLLSGGGPGLWMPLDRLIGRVFLKKGTSRTVVVDFQGSEVDEGIERPLGFKDEHGAASGSITLDCCTSKIYPPMPTDLSFDFGGSGGGNPGAISLAFYARRVCC